MILIFIQKSTPRVTYVFKHVFTRILGIEISFTSEIEHFIAHQGAKFSYGKQPLGNELFFQSHGLLFQQGIESVELSIKPWDDTIGFFPVSPKSAMPFDIFSAIFYLLSRYEEYLPHVKDALGRFPVDESVAFKNNFLENPVVDIWSYKLCNLLQEQFPAIHFKSRTFNIHTLVMAKEPYAYAQKGIFRSTIAYFQDIFKLRLNAVAERTKVLVGYRRDPYDTFKWMVNVAKNKKARLSVFFLLGESQEFQESINSHRTKFKMLIKFVADYFDVGLIVSFKALTDDVLLKKEKRLMEETVNRSLKSSINTNLYVGLPEVYRNLITLEVLRDATMVYEETPGFRASTCTPFLFYDLDFEIRTPLLIQPLACTTSGFVRKSPLDSKQQILRLKTQVEKVHGTFSMLFTNKNFSATPNNKVWRSLFSETLHNE